MPVAELHGKLSDTGSNVQDRLEDLLTSDVFGPLRYLPDSRAVLAMLAGAELVDWSRQYLGDWEPVRNLCAETEAPQVQVRFWPMLDFSEPDILYEWALGDSRRFFLMVEVKYLSGPSDTDPKWVDEATPAVSLQLDKEREDLRRLVRRHPQASGALVYLTGNNSRPRDVIPEPLRVGAMSDGVSVYWTNWLKVYQEVCKAFELSSGGRRVLYADIKALLERKGFAGMAPWGRVLSTTDSWSLDEAAYSYKSAPVETQYSWQTKPLRSVAFYSTISLFSGMKAFYRWPESAGDTGGVGFYKGRTWSRTIGAYQQNRTGTVTL